MKQSKKYIKIDLYTGEANYINFDEEEVCLKEMIEGYEVQEGDLKSYVGEEEIIIELKN